MRRSSSGISPVVATVILVAIAIVIAIAVAFWASGLVGVFTRFERIDTISAYSTTAAGTGTGRIIILEIKNSGSASATVDNIFINGRPCITAGTDNCGIWYSVDGGTNWSEFPATTGLTLNIGDQAMLLIDADPDGEELIAGVIYEVSVHTASGKSYPSSVQIT